MRMNSARRILRPTAPVAKRFQSSSKKGLIERLNEGPVIGDGGYVFAMEKRGYTKAGPWTPEATVEHPEAVIELHREFARCGADVLQTFTFYASEDKLDNRGNYAAKNHGVRDINLAACKLAQQVSNEFGGLTAGGICQTPTYLSGMGEQKTKDEFRKQTDIFLEQDVDFIIAEYFEHVEEAVWAVEVLKESGKPVVASLCINDEGDLHGIPTAKCAKALAEAGAQVVGLNCHFGPFEALKGMKKIKEGLKDHPDTHMIVQPLGYHTPDAGVQGFIDLPEFPFGLEPRVCTRYEIHKWTREAYELGIRYIGGCCGIEPYHTRAMAEALMVERQNRLPEASKKHALEAAGLLMHTKPWVRARAKKSYWQNLMPASGRPLSPSISIPDQWGVTQGDGDLKQEFSGSHAK